jgi:hypothetical protein
MRRLNVRTPIAAVRPHGFTVENVCKQAHNVLRLFKEKP